MTVEIANYVAGFIAFSATNPPLVVASNSFDESTLARSGAGVYSVDMDAPGNIDSNSAVRVTRSGTAADSNVNGSITAGAGSAPPTIDVNTFDAAGAAADTADIILVEIVRFPTVD